MKWVLFDSTPDFPHRDQISQAVDFISIAFIETHAKDAAPLKITILKKLNVDEILVTKCRSEW